MIRAARRNKLPKSKFGLPGQRKYPIDTKKRAANAKGRATQQYKRGRISKAAMQKVHARANKVLKRKKGK